MLGALSIRRPNIPDGLKHPTERYRTMHAIFTAPEQSLLAFGRCIAPPQRARKEERSEEREARDELGSKR